MDLYEKAVRLHRRYNILTTVIEGTTKDSNDWVTLNKELGFVNSTVNSELLKRMAPLHIKETPTDIVNIADCSSFLPYRASQYENSNLHKEVAHLVKEKGYDSWSHNEDGTYTIRTRELEFTCLLSRELMHEKSIGGFTRCTRLILKKQNVPIFQFNEKLIGQLPESMDILREIDLFIAIFC